MTYEIAIIEDNKDIITLYLDAFQNMGEEISCEFYTDAESALSKLKDKRVDLILSDINLPGMNGLELVKILRKKSANSNSLFYIVSGFVEDSTKAVAEEYRDIRIFEKPLKSISRFAKQCFEDLKTRVALKYDPEILELVRDSAFTLLNEYFAKEPIIGRCQLTPLNTEATSVRGYIPFTSGGIDGSIAVDLGHGIFEKFRDKIDPHANLTPSDIAYEMANQLAGQLKTISSEKGYAVTIGIPEATTLEDVLCIRNKQNPIVYIPAGYIGALFRIEFEMSSLSLTQASPENNTVNSGEMLLFD